MAYPETKSERRLLNIFRVYVASTVISILAFLVVLIWIVPVLINISALLENINPTQEQQVLATIAAAAGPLDASVGLIDAITNLVNNTNATQFDQFMGNVSGIISQINIPSILNTLNVYQQDIRVLTTILNNTINANGTVTT